MLLLCLDEVWAGFSGAFLIVAVIGALRVHGRARRITAAARRSVAEAAEHHKKLQARRVRDSTPHRVITSLDNGLETLKELFRDCERRLACVYPSHSDTSLILPAQISILKQGNTWSS